VALTPPTLTRTKPADEWLTPGPAGTFVHHRGELLGWSWLFPPYRWAFGAVAASPVEAFEFDARAVRACCASDPVLGYEVTRRLALVVAKRLQATRVMLITAAGQPAGLGRS
jgi:CRP-like cAMP-binding protein